MIVMTKEEFGQRLKQRRKEKGFGQKKLAKLIGADQPMISRWEKNKIFPSEPYQQKLMTILGVDPSFFDQSPAPEEDGGADDIAWPYIINKLASAEHELRQLKELANKSPHKFVEMTRPITTLDPDLQRAHSYWNDAGQVTRSVCLYLLTGLDEDLQRVHMDIRDELKGLRKLIPRLRSSKS